MDAVKIFTDGSCRKVDGDMRAGVGVYSPAWNAVRMSGRVHTNTATNNVAELCAIGVAAHWIATGPAFQELSRGTQIIIYTDSRYAFDCLVLWYKHWVRSEWVKSDGGEVKNAGLITAVLALLYWCREHLNLNVSLCWVKAHTNALGNELGYGNNEADALATRGLTGAADCDVSSRAASVLALGVECTPSRPRRRSTTTKGQ